MFKFAFALLFALLLIAPADAAGKCGSGSTINNLLATAEPTLNYKAASTSRMVAAATDPFFCYDGWTMTIYGEEGPFHFAEYYCGSTGVTIRCYGYGGSPEYCYCVSGGC